MAEMNWYVFLISNRICSQEFLLLLFQIMKSNEKMYNLLLISLVLCPQVVIFLTYNFVTCIILFVCLYGKHLEIRSKRVIRNCQELFRERVILRIVSHSTSFNTTNTNIICSLNLILHSFSLNFQHKSHYLIFICPLCKFPR